MPVFLERFILPMLAAIAVGVVLINPMKFDIPQRISLAVAVLAFAYFVGHTLHRTKTDFGSRPPSVPSAFKEPSTTGDARTSGDQSPAIPGNGNSVEYKLPEPAGQAHKARSK
jgi:hypothetical protein